MKYSIIIPTYNNAAKLQRCLEHIICLDKPQAEFEVIVIDNGSTDNTAQVVQRYSFVKYFYDQTPGLHTGRHLGAKQAQGDMLCYIDDDSFVEQGWLIAIEETFRNSDVVLAGGNNLPLYETKPPQWLNFFWSDSPYGRFMGEVSLIDFKQAKMKLPAWFVFGCNFIIKKSTLIELGGFNPDGMPQELIRFRGDGETALSCKLNQQGYVAHFNPKIQIQHFVTASRMTKSYLQKRAFNQGVSNSFSKIRQENGFDYFDFAPNSQVEQVKPSFFRRKFNKLIRKPITKLTRIFDPAYREYKAIRAETEKSYQDGFDFHQNEVKNDPELLKWVLRESYFKLLNERM